MASHPDHHGSRPGESTKPAPEVPGARVMVIDDMADIQNLLRDFLESEGYTVEVFGDAADALIRLAEFRPRVILLDILMPGLSGISALQRTRARYPDVEVIMVTGVGDEEVAKQTLGLGAFDYVTKPIDFTYLKWALETCLLMPPFVLEIHQKAGEIAIAWGSDKPAGTGRPPEGCL